MGLSYIRVTDDILAMSTPQPINLDRDELNDADKCMTAACKKYFGESFKEFAFVLEGFGAFVL